MGRKTRGAFNKALRTEADMQDLSAEEEAFNEIEVTTEVFLDAIQGLIKSNIKEFELLKGMNSPSELTEEQKSQYRNLQKSELDS